MAYPVTNNYKQVIYGQDYDHVMKIYFNNVELSNADRYCEKLTVKSRILANGDEVFSLNNFISKEAELILHDVDLEDIASPISISIGTYIDADEDYEYVPIGIFNIEEEPVTDKNKITLKLRDNSVKFDFNYNAKTIIDNNYVVTTDTTYQDNKEYYSYDSSEEEYTLLVAGTDYNVGDTISGTVYIKPNAVTKLQIFNDICTQAGVSTDITTFVGSSDLIGIYDNTVTAREYISNLAEQAGKIATIDRTGKLIFVDLLNLTTWTIPLSVVESYEIGTHYKIGKVVYESGIIKYETADSVDDTLFIDASNQYINENSVSNILDEVEGFEIDAMSTGKILGNPAIDPYDLISITDGDNTYITLATNDLVYTGTMINTFETNIGEKEKEQNTTTTGEKTFKRWATTTIDSVKSEVEISTGKVEALDLRENNNYQETLSKFQSYDQNIGAIESIQTSVTQLQTNTYTKTEVQQIANGTGVDGVKVSAVISTSGTFDENGMTYEKTNAKTKTTINEVGVNVKDSSDKSLLFAGYVDSNNTDYPDYEGQTIVGTDNIIVKNYLNIGTHSRIQDYNDGTDDGTGIFYLGGGI